MENIGRFAVQKPNMIIPWQDSILSVATYDRGVRFGPAWQGSPAFGVLLHGPASREDKGRIGGEEDGEVLLCHLSNATDAFAVTGVFRDSILQGQGVPRRVSKVWFTHGGFMMRMEASSGQVMEHEEGRHYRLRLAPHLVLPGDRFHAQADWLWNQRYDQVHPNGAVMDREALEQQVRNGVDMVQAVPEHPDPKCATMLKTDQAVPGIKRGIDQLWLYHNPALTIRIGRFPPGEVPGLLPGVRL